MEEEQTAVELPPAMVNALCGKRFGLIGFAKAQAASLMRILEEAQAFSRVLGWPRGEQWARLLAPFDLCVLALAPEQDLAAMPQELLAGGKPLLLVGSRQQLLRYAGQVGGHSCDFLVAPWQAEDLLLRSLNLLSHALHNGSGRRSAEGKPLVLVADDDATTSTIVATVLRNYGMECQVANDGRQALEIAKRLLPHAAVLDINMPEFDGFQVLAALKQDPATKEVGVIMLTSRHQETDVLRGFGLGADDYVTKPFNPSELAARLKRLLRSGE